ncbi:MAG: DNA polymerase III subunit gamma/tau [Gammaproteobacteria bacterium]
MASHVLARQWRPKTFDTVVGQGPVLQALTHALATQRLHHAYLFTGTRGVGKTTLARLFAKAVNCETGITPTPCGKCSACLAIDAGRFVDLIEVDAASRTKVEDTRDLLDNVQYAPTQGRYKIYLIDEVHMLSGHSFNALLKTLEEPPEHVIFLLATTDPQKLPITVLSRCLQFHLKHVGEADVAAHLAHILDAESTKYESEALAMVAAAGQGSVRDSLSLLDQAIAFSGGNVTAAAVREMLGALNPNILPRLLAALAARDGGALMAASEDIAQENGDYMQALRLLMQGLHDLALWQTIGDDALLGIARFDVIQPWLKSFSPEDIQLYYQMALQGVRDLPFAANPRVGFQMTVLRMLAFAPEQMDAPALVKGAPEQMNAPALVKGAPEQMNAPAFVKGAPEQMNSPPFVKGGARRAEGFSVGVTASPACAPILPPSSPSIEEDIIAEDISVKMEPPPMAISAPPAPMNDPPFAKEGAQPISSPPFVKGGAQRAEGFVLPPWEEFLTSLRLTGMAGMLASHCVLKEFDGHRILCVLSKAHAALFNKAVAARIEQAICDNLNQKIRLEVEIVDAIIETPADNRAKAQSAAWEQAKQTLEADPIVKGLRETLDAKIDEGSIST